MCMFSEQSKFGKKKCKWRKMVKYAKKEMTFK